MPDYPISGFDILIVDDEPNIIEEIQESLEDAGFHCLTAPNAEIALRIVKQHPGISLVISDHKMPGMHGRELLSQIRSLKQQKCGCILMSGHLKISSDDIDDGNITLLRKPFDIEALLAKVKQVQTDMLKTDECSRDG